MTDTTLWSRNRVVGYIPREAIDPLTQTINIAVDLELANGMVKTIVIITSPQELRRKLLEPGVLGLRDLRAWIAERARVELASAYPQHPRSTQKSPGMYWIFLPSRQRHRFLW